MRIIEAAGSVLRRPLERVLPQRLTLVERQYKLAEALRQYPVTNKSIWWHIIDQNRGFITKEERDRIIQGYKIYRELNPDSNTPVSDILAVAKLPRARTDRFFTRVCFNYDRATDAQERYETAMGELQRGERNRVDLTDPQIWTLDQWVNFEFDRMQRSPFMNLREDERFNKNVNAEETVWHTTHFGITDHEHTRRDLPDKVFPLLDVTEIIKPPPLSDWLVDFPSRPARAARLFGDVEIYPNTA